MAQYWHLPEIKYSDNGRISNWEQVYAAIKEKCSQLYPDCRNSNPKNENNAVNKFIAYHLLPMRIRWDQIVQHHLSRGLGDVYKRQVTNIMKPWVRHNADS